MLRVLLALEGWGCYQGVAQQPSSTRGYPVSSAATLSLPTPHISGEDRDTALHPRISPAPGAVPVQEQCQNQDMKQKPEPGESYPWLRLLQQAAGLMEVKANPAPVLMKISSLL